MLQELSHMDRITQLQDEIQQVYTIPLSLSVHSYLRFGLTAPHNHVKHYRVPHLSVELRPS